MLLNFCMGSSLVPDSIAACYGATCGECCLSDQNIESEFQREKYTDSKQHLLESEPSGYTPTTYHQNIRTGQRLPPLSSAPSTTSDVTPEKDAEPHPKKDSDLVDGQIEDSEHSESPLITTIVTTPNPIQLPMGTESFGFNRIDMNHEDPMSDSLGTDSSFSNDAPEGSRKGHLVHTPDESMDDSMDELQGLSPLHAPAQDARISFSSVGDLIPGQSYHSLSEQLTKRTPTPSSSDIDEETDAVLFVSPYKSESEMLRSEQIDLLINMEIPDKIGHILGDPAGYTLPTSNPALSHMKRDMRKIKVSLLEYKLEGAEQRKYAKLCILKYYDLLTSIYKRYCKIGRDTQWMTMFGWISLLRDCGMAKTHSDEQQYIDVFGRIYQYHHEHLHSARKDMNHSRHSISQSGMYGDAHLHDKDPWTGVWMLQKYRNRVCTRISENGHHLPLPLEATNHTADRQSHQQVAAKYRADKKSKIAMGTFNISASHSFVSDASSDTDSMEEIQYKFRKMGDRKIIGFVRSKTDKDSLVTGWLNRNDFKKAKLETKSKKQRKDKRVLQCQLIAPQSFMDSIRMKIKWQHTKTGSTTTESGTVKLFKFETLGDGDTDLPITRFVGLSRHEFFDALLSVARLSDGDRPLFLLFHEVITNQFDTIYRNMVDLRQYLKGKEIEPKIRHRLQSDSALVRLFNRYSSLQKQERNMEEDAWCALAADLFSTAKSIDHKVWKHGGKPTPEQLGGCFSLSKAAKSMDEEWIDFSEFLRCLLHFTAAIYRDQPSVRYRVLTFKKKLDLVLKWCHKLDAQSKMPSVRIFRSPSLQSVKMHRQRSESIHSVISAPTTPTTTTNTTPRGSSGASSSSSSASESATFEDYGYGDLSFPSTRDTKLTQLNE